MTSVQEQDITSNGDDFVYPEDGDFAYDDDIIAADDISGGFLIFLESNIYV